MQTKHLFHILNKGEVGAVKSSSKQFLLSGPRRYFYCGPFVLFMS